MPNLQTYLQYHDPLTIVSRAGTDIDPYVDRTDSLPIINSIITLLEIPSKTEGIQIAGLIEIDQDIYEHKPYLNPNEFLVNYSVGIIQFHPSLEGTVKLCRYKGRGLILYPASRIYAMVSRSPDVVITLQDYIEEIESKINQNQLIIEEINALLNQVREAKDATLIATDNANKATDEAQKATVLALDAYQTTRLIFLPPVAKFSDVTSTYPAPTVGMTIQTYLDGKRYRYDGNHWIEIDIFGSNLQVVNDTKDGLMSVSDYQKLKSFPSDLRDRVICFSLPDAVQGQIQNFIAFPFDGTIIEARAFCQTSGQTPTTISIERQRVSGSWEEITNNRIIIPVDSQSDNQTATFSSSEVQAGDMFRINMIHQGFGFSNLTLTLKIRT